MSVQATWEHYKKLHAADTDDNTDALKFNFVDVAITVNSRLLKLSERVREAAHSMEELG